MINNTLNPQLEQLLSEQMTPLSTADQNTIAEVSQAAPISALVDGRGLACPMPLLKTKVALRSMQPGQSIYVLATDPNSQHDLAAFCDHANLQLALNTSSVQGPVDSLEKLDTIFHLIITKTNGN
ncbi:sulfurtransferase TusA family protein [Psychrobacter raelei]|uniref:sulfurtransferase TusA family protein n=1 Tax=Psychrobacter raelei TaxID=2565531 RepID=UPI003F62BEFE